MEREVRKKKLIKFLGLSEKEAEAMVDTYNIESLIKTLEKRKEKVE